MKDPSSKLTICSILGGSAASIAEINAPIPAGGPALSIVPRTGPVIKQTAKRVRNEPDAAQATQAGPKKARSASRAAKKAGT
jgi:hypothetical protein